MPYDSNGNYTLPSEYKAIAGTTIVTQQHNGPFEDVQAALNAVLLRSGAAAMTGPLNMGNNSINNLADGKDTTDAATIGQLQKYLYLSGTTLQTVTGPVTFAGATLVPSVSDWESNQPVTAAQAEARYIRSPTYPATDYRVLTISRNKASGGIFVYAEDGSNTQIQPAGDYATNSALNAEAQRASNVESNLQSSKVSRYGDTMTGGLTITSGGVLIEGAYYVGKGIWGGDLGTRGNVPWASQFISKYNDGYKGQSLFCHRTLVGSYEYASIQVTDAGGGFHELQFRSDDRLYTASGNQFALTSELPTSGTVPGGTYTKIGNILQQHFTVGGIVHVDNGFWVSFPVAYSQTPQAINLTANVNGDMDVAWFGASPTGFFICIPYNSAASNQPVSVLISGVA